MTAHDLCASVVTVRAEVQLRSRRSRRRYALVIAATAALFAAVAFPALFGRDSAVPGRYSAAAVEAAEHNPRLIIEQGGWKPTYLDGFADETGSISYSRGGADVEFNWAPANQYDDRREDHPRTVDRHPARGLVVLVTSRQWVRTGTMVRGGEYSFAAVSSSRARPAGSRCCGPRLIQRGGRDLRS